MTQFFSTLLAQRLDTGGGFTSDLPYAKNAADSTQVLSTFETVISNALGLLTVLAGLFFIMTFFLAAFKWLSAGGDSGKVQKARDEMVQAVLGLIIVVAAYAIIGLIGTIVGINILQPAKTIMELVPTT